MFVSRPISQVIGCEDRLRNDLYCVKWGVKLYSNQPYKKLTYRRGTARCVVSVEILPIAMQHCRNYLYDKS